MKYQIFANCFTRRAGKQPKPIMRVPASEPIADFEEAREIAKERNATARAKNAGRETTVVYSIREVSEE